DRRRCVLELIFLASILGSGPGCLGHLHPVAMPSPEATESCAAVAEARRDRVHVFFINGLDPTNRANFYGLSEPGRPLGFPHVTYGQMYDQPEMRREIVRIHEQDPEAKFVVVGYSLGANLAGSLTHALAREGVTVDLLVYLGGDTLSNSPADLPDNAHHII